MIVEELIKALKTVNPKSLVIVAKDAEGNDFRPLANVEHREFAS